jgi:hypothetical protein
MNAPVAGIVPAKLSAADQATLDEYVDENEREFRSACWHAARINAAIAEHFESIGDEFGTEYATRQLFVYAKGAIETTARIKQRRIEAEVAHHEAREREQEQESQNR